VDQLLELFTRQLEDGKFFHVGCVSPCSTSAGALAVKVRTLSPASGDEPTRQRGRAA
jgi:hypothetical protein